MKNKFLYIICLFFTSLLLACPRGGEGEGVEAVWSNTDPASASSGAKGEGLVEAVDQRTPTLLVYQCNDLGSVGRKPNVFKPLAQMTECGLLSARRDGEPCKTDPSGCQDVGGFHCFIVSAIGTLSRPPPPVCSTWNRVQFDRN